MYRLRERKHFEDRLRMNRNAIGAWLKYAAFEEAQRDGGGGQEAPHLAWRGGPLKDAAVIKDGSKVSAFFMQVTLPHMLLLLWEDASTWWLRDAALE